MVSATKQVFIPYAVYPKRKKRTVSEHPEKELCTLAAVSVLTSITAFEPQQAHPRTNQIVFVILRHVLDAMERGKDLWSEIT